MISMLRSWMFNRSLEEHPNFSIKRNFAGVNHCSSYCLISSTQELSKSSTEDFKRKLESFDKSVDTLYFSDGREEIEKGYSRQNISWKGIPQNDFLNSIFSKEYDVLIFLNPNFENHLFYICKLIKAKFKIGPNFEKGTEVFDLSIDLKDFSNTSLLIKSIENQLKQISS